MRYLFMLGVAAVSLSGCTSPNLIEHQLYVPKVNESLFAKCKVVNVYPEASKLTDIQVANTINELDRNNHNCKAVVDAVHAILLKANMIAQ